MVEADTADPKQLSRRGLFRELRNGALRASGIVAINAVGWEVKDLEVNDGLVSHEQEAAEELKLGNLAVRYFAKDIASTARRINHSSSTLNILEMLMGWFATDTIPGYFLKDKSKLLNRIVGAACLIAGRSIDTLSTIAATDPTLDPRFTEYGLNFYFKEQNPFLSAQPTREELIKKGIFEAPFLVISGLSLPSFGRGYFGASPFIAGNNLGAKRNIITSMALGDDVKRLIGRGADQAGVKDFLQGLASQPKGLPNA